MPRTPTATPRRPPRHMQVNLERLDDGRVRVSTPQARGAAYVARGPHQMWHALSRLWCDATDAGRAAWEGKRTDLDWLTDRDDPTEPPRQKLPSSTARASRRVREPLAVGYSHRDVSRPDQADPADWWPDEPRTVDGVEVRAWRSPNGRRWTAPKVLGPLLAKRSLLGLSTTFEQWRTEQADAAVEVPA